MNELIHAVLFDAVGTVIYPAPAVDRVYAEAGRRFGSRYDAAAISTRFAEILGCFDDCGVTSETNERDRWLRIVSDVFDDIPGSIEPLFAELWDHFAAPNHWLLFDDVPPIWAWLREQTVTIGIASNFDSRLDAICRAKPPLDSADHLFCSSLIGYSKPRPEFFAHAQRALDLPPHQILLVGDHPANDYAAARAAGWQAVLIQRDGRGPGKSALSQLSQLQRFDFA